MSNMKFRLCVCVVAICALQIVGCASSENVVGTYSDQWQKNTYIKPGQMGLTDPQFASAKRAGILNKEAENSGGEMVVATFKSNIYTLPTALSTSVGSLARGTPVTVQQQLMWYELPPEWKAETKTSPLAIWVKVRAGKLSGFMASRELCKSDRLMDAGQVAGAALDVEEVAQKGFSDEESKKDKSRLAKLTKGAASGDAMAGAMPDFEKIDAFISGAGNVIPNQTTKGPKIDFQNPTLTECFFVGRLQAGKILAVQKALPAKHPVSEYVQGVGTSVARNSTLPVPYLNYIFIVLRDDQTLNAWSLPGGFIFVTTGLLRMLDNEDQLACILAHEVAHIELGHPTAAVAEIDSEKETGETFNTLMDLGSQAAEMSGNKNAQYAAQAVQLAAPVFGAVLFENLQKGYDQSSETASDARAMTLASAAGYEASALRAALNKFKNNGGKTDATHYSPQRYEQVDQLLTVYINRFLKTDKSARAGTVVPNLDAVIPQKRVIRYQKKLAQLPEMR